MAESLLLPMVRGVAGKAADELVLTVTRMWGVDDYRRRLERHLVYVQSLLADAEEKSKTNEAVKMWMKALRSVAYEADDVLDDFRYEALRREAQSLRQRSMASKVLLTNIFSSKKHRLVFRYKASKDLKHVLDKIDELTHSTLDESEDIFGRDDDKEVLVKLLLDQQDGQRHVQVLPIIGMGGLGKTTLAKMVYNDSRIQKHFELHLWHCVSENFEAPHVVRSVIELATKARCDLGDTIELLRGKLQDVIGRKRFLLVLDDVWNEDHQKWEDLKPILCSSIGGLGSMIIVTSRSKRVASIMGSFPPHELSCMSEEDSWRLFSIKAFSREVQEQPELVRIGNCIVNKCKGLPLALKTMGGLMSSKQAAWEWEAIADSNICDTSRGKDEVLPILKLSYRHLSFEMKQCFAFFAIFPKDYEMEKYKLIELWMANGYILEEETMNYTQKGEFIFNELVWRSFLDVVHMSSDFYVEVGCKMHDLMHDLAKDVTNDECASAQELDQKKASIADVHHMQLSKTELRKISGLLNGKPSLRTLLLTYSVGEDFNELKWMPLRALCYQISYYGINDQLLNSAHLRYLDLSYSSMVALPNSVCLLYNLQTLRLNRCHNLQYLPKDLATMRKLSHIHLLNCDSLEQMPPNLRLLHNLHTLTTFVVHTSDGCGISELKDMRQLSNKLELYNLRKVIKSGSKVNLHEKKNISHLCLYWGRKEGYVPANDKIKNNEEQVLESLVPHCELKMLGLHGYSALAVPQWMRDAQMFPCIRELSISNCPGFKDMPIIWLASSLEKLRLRNMNNLTTLCKYVDVETTRCNTSLEIFSKLKRVELQDLPKLESWAETRSGEPWIGLLVFPQLEELNIKNCRKLATLPQSPALKKLSCYRESSGDVAFPLSISMGSWPSLVRLEVGLVADILMPPLEEQQNQGQNPPTTIRTLRIQSNDGFISMLNPSKQQVELQGWFAFVEELFIGFCNCFVCWPMEELRCMPCLRSLYILGCHTLEGKKGCSSEEIFPLPRLEKLGIDYCEGLVEIPMLPPSLEAIYIDGCKSLMALPSNLGDLAKLTDLRIHRCDALKVLPDHGMDGFAFLEQLEINECAGIEMLPPGLFQRLPALKYLFLWHCPRLKTLPDWMDTMHSLVSLNIHWCPMIEKFPRGIEQRLPSLKYLRIYHGCPDLQKRCRPGGEYYDLISSIPDKKISAPEPNRKIKMFVKKHFLLSC
uniref:Uncharacterized protein n=1 Tax=Oryza brachyantha TaxID=4533 RepID=J3MQU7_ORYBR